MSSLPKFGGICAVIFLCGIADVRSSPPNLIVGKGGITTGLPNVLPAKTGELLKLKVDLPGETAWDVPEGVIHYIDEAQKTLVLPTFKPGTIVVSVWTVEDKKPVRAARVTINITDDGITPPPDPKPPIIPTEFIKQLADAFEKDKLAEIGTKEQVLDLAEIYRVHATNSLAEIITVNGLKESINANRKAKGVEPAFVLKNVQTVIAGRLKPLYDVPPTTPLDRAKFSAEFTQIVAALKEIAK